MLLLKVVIMNKVNVDIFHPMHMHCTCGIVVISDSLKIEIFRENNKDQLPKSM